MKHLEGHFYCIRHARLYWQAWLPKTESRAILVIAHSYDDPSKRFINIVNHFVTNGFAVYELNQVGQGKSEGTRGFVHKFEDYTKTLHFFLRMVRNMQAGKQVFLVGFNMGGLIASIYLLNNQQEFAGVLLIGPLVKVPENVTVLTILMCKIFSVILPKARIVNLEEEVIQKNQKNIDKNKPDKLISNRKMTSRLISESLKAIERLSNEGTQITLPVLILQRTEQRSSDPSGEQMLFDLIQSKDKQIKFYPGNYYDIFKENKSKTIFADIEEWLNQHTGL